ncbi:MAG: hypothetical protein KIS91_14510 [Anaerolineae bacterium]|nr:hypothetical protein [Anaerolineae bacterium]
MAEQPGLPILQAGGFSASVDAYAWEPDPDQGQRLMRLWFLSLLGPQQAVKALWARLVKGEIATLSVETLGQARFCRLAPDGPQGWRFLTASLPIAAGYQGVLVPQVACYSHEALDFLLLPCDSHAATCISLPQSACRPAASPHLGQLALAAGAAGRRGHATGGAGSPGLPLSAPARHPPR